LCERLEFDSISDDTLFTYFTFFNKFCMNFIVRIISKEGSLPAANSDWILNVLTKLKISVSFFNLFKLEQIIQMQYQKSFQLLIENNKILNFQSIKDTLNDKVNSMIKYWSKHFNQQSVQQIMNIFLNEDEYNDYNNFHVIAHKIIDEYSKNYKETEKFNHGSEKINKNHGSEEIIKYLGSEEINENYRSEKINEKNFGVEYINENHGSELVNEKNLGIEKINENHESESIKE
ncbi:6573_t:CDS:2, partial [Funneliformis caledonium]